MKSKGFKSSLFDRLSIGNNITAAFIIMAECINRIIKALLKLIFYKYKTCLLSLFVVTTNFSFGFSKRGPDLYLTAHNELKLAAPALLKFF